MGTKKQLLTAGWIKEQLRIYWTISENKTILCVIFSLKVRDMKENVSPKRKISQIIKQRSQDAFESIEKF